MASCYEWVRSLINIYETECSTGYLLVVIKKSSG
jgi:hypothetical protein